MKLLRYGPAGHEKPGVLDRDGHIRDLSGVVKDINGEALSPSSLDRLRRLDPATLPLVSGSPRIGACVGNPSKVLAIGLNYRKHAEEAGMPIPSEPIFFIKATSSICGPNDDVDHPQGLAEDRLRGRARRSSSAPPRATSRSRMRRSTSPAIASSTTSPSANTRWSVAASGPRARAATRSARWGRGWSPPTSSGDAGKLQVTTDVNGERRQDSNTADLIFGIEHIVSYCSHFMTLNPGDVIPTGTPSGRRDGLQAAASSCAPATACASRSRASASRTTGSSPIRADGGTSAEMTDDFGAFVPGERFRIEGKTGGPLAGLTFAAKDLFDVAGHPTGGGNPDWATRAGQSRPATPGRCSACSMPARR